MTVHIFDVQTTGAAGNATGSAQSAQHLPPGVLESIIVEYDAAAPPTTDLVIREAGGLGRTLFTLTDVNDANVEPFYSPRYPTHDDTGTPTGSYEAIVTSGPLRVEVSQCDPLAVAVRVKIQLSVSNVVD